MLFNSFSYMIFLPIVFILYWIIPQRQQWILLLVSSYYFYMSWNPKYIVLILGTTIVSYWMSIFIERSDNRQLKKIYLSLTIFTSLGILIVFKYFNFLSGSLEDMLSIFSIKLHPITLNLLLPVGISFYTFQTMSYVIDVYTGKIQAEHHFGYYATFISFFPQLVAGPIERTSSLLPQIKQIHIFDYEKASDGLKIMLWGYYKKIVIADTLAKYVDIVYKNVSDYSGFAFIIVIFFFTIQIYCDFSGYSNIAVGTAKLLGIELTTNFAAPYFSSSIREFWKRWHISLSTWFKDYVYIPLGGNRCSVFRQNFNILITFLASGIWHGADWTYVIWGVIHGLAQIFENIFHKSIKKVKGYKIGQIFLWIFVFTFCNLAWVFFRAQTLGEAFYVFRNMFRGITNPILYFMDGFNALGISKRVLLYLCMLIIVFVFVDFLSYKWDIIKKIREKNIVVRWIGYMFIALMVVLFSQKGVAAEFVYFQF